MDYPIVSIVILNWNGWKDTIECLESLYQINYPNFNIIVVDNASKDESVLKIKEYFQIEGAGESVNDDFTLIENNENYGFAEGNNIGIEYAINYKNPDYILLLNNDTIVNKNFLEEMVKVAEKNVNIGSVQSILLKPGGKRVDSMGQELTTWSARDVGMDSEYDESIGDMEIFGACAAAALYRTDILEDLGLFDKDFFAIYEDVDLSWRIRLAGYKSILAVNSLVFHKRNISKAVSELKNLDWMKNDSKRYHLTKNMLILAIRYHPTSYLLKPRYPFKLILTLIGCTYYSLRAGGTMRTFWILYKNFMIRRTFKTNPRLLNLQNKWIN